MIKNVVEKLTSGKFLFTMGALIVFMYVSITGKLGMDKVHEVVLIVLYAYFTKRSENGTDKSA